MTLPKKVKIFSAAILLTALGGSILYMNRPASSASAQSTDDAYVQADLITVSPQISGTVDKVHVEDNQLVKTGQLLATIDDREFTVAVQGAKAQVANAQAGIKSFEAQLVRQKSTIDQAAAALKADNASLALAKTNQARYRNLASDGSGTIQAQEQAEAQLNIQLANSERNRAVLLGAQQQVAILQADVDKAKAALLQAEAAESAADLKISYTRITAPSNGTVGHKSVRAGAFVTNGKPLLEIVPLDNVYITANYRETQLAHVRQGQKVEVTIDALPGEKLKGTVDSIGPASGVSYSAIAPHNATGNFTKIVQRLPVRIRILPDQAASSKLRVGMSVTTTIHTN